MTARHWIKAALTLRAVERAGVTVAAELLTVVRRAANGCARRAAEASVREASDADWRGLYDTARRQR